MAEVSTTGQLWVVHGQFMVTAGFDYPQPPADRLDDNGVARAWGNYVWIKTGVEMGLISVTVQALAEQPQEVDTDSWDDVVELSEEFTAPEAKAVTFEDLGPPGWPALTGAPEWYRVRIHCLGRDLEFDGVASEAREKYLIQAWPAPPAEPTTYKLTDQVSENWRSAVATSLGGER